METLEGHFHNWFGVLFFVVVYGVVPMLILYPVMIVMYLGLAKREEIDMLAEFGQEYREYIKTTKMFIPFVV